MTASHLTSTEAKLWVDILNALTAGTFSHLTMSQAEIKQRILNNLSGGSISYLTTGQHQMVQSILTELQADGISYSALTYSPPQVLAAVVNDIEEGGGGEGPSPLVLADFTTATYTSGGTPVAVTSLFIGDGDYGTLFSTDDISASGLAAGGGGPSFAGDLLAVAIDDAGSTVLFEVDMQDETNMQVQVANNPSFDAWAGFYVSRSASDSSGDGDIEGSPVAFTAAQKFVVGRNRVALTFGPTEMAISVNGAAAETCIPTAPFVWAEIVGYHIYGTPWQFLRSVKAFNKLDNAALPALTALT